MKLNDFELLQPVEWDGIKGYISFICEDYLTICFIDEPLPTSANSRWGRHYVSILVYPQHYHEIRCRLDETKEEGQVPQIRLFIGTSARPSRIHTTQNLSSLF